MFQYVPSASPRAYPQSRGSVAYIHEPMYAPIFPREPAYQEYLRESVYPEHLRESIYPEYLHQSVRPEPSYAGFDPRGLSADERYLRAVAELRAAEEEYAAARSREAAVDRQHQAAAEAARRQEALAVYAEVERARRQHTIPVQAEAQRERARQLAQLNQAAEQEQQQLLLEALFRTEERVPEPEPEYLADSGRRRRSVFQPGAPAPAPVQRRSQPPSHRPEEVTLDVDFSDFFEHLSQHAHGAPQAPVPAARQEAPATASSDATVTMLQDLLALFLRHAERSEPETSQPAAPKDVKGKGKAPAPAPPAPAGPSTFRSPLQQRLDEREQEDIRHAIQLSLAEQYKAARAAGSDTRATSSHVTLDGAELSRAHALAGAAAAHAQASFQAHRTASTAPAPPAASSRAAPTTQSIPAVPPSPLTVVRAIRTEFLTLQSGSLADASAHAHALDGLLARLDAVDSDGDEEVRDVRREVVKDVEKALEGLERGEKKVENAEAKGYDLGDAGHAPVVAPAIVAKVSVPEMTATAAAEVSHPDAAFSVPAESAPAEEAKESPTAPVDISDASEDDKSSTPTQHEEPVVVEGSERDGEEWSEVEA